MELVGEAQEVVAPPRGKAAADTRPPPPQSSLAECSYSSQMPAPLVSVARPTEAYSAAAAPNSLNSPPTHVGAPRKANDQHGEKAGNYVPEGPARLTFLKSR